MQVNSWNWLRLTIESFLCSFDRLSWSCSHFKLKSRCSLYMLMISRSLNIVYWSPNWIEEVGLLMSWITMFKNILLFYNWSFNFVDTLFPFAWMFFKAHISWRRFSSWNSGCFIATHAIDYLRNLLPAWWKFYAEREFGTLRLLPMGLGFSPL